MNGGNRMSNLKEFMDEEKKVNRWFIFKVAMRGALAGVTLAVMVSWIGLVFP